MRAHRINRYLSRKVLRTEIKVNTAMPTARISWKRETHSSGMRIDIPVTAAARISPRSGAAVPVPRRSDFSPEWPSGFLNGRPPLSPAPSARENR